MLFFLWLIKIQNSVQISGLSKAPAMTNQLSSDLVRGESFPDRINTAMVI
jgi:hypothetical protein